MVYAILFLFFTLMSSAFFTVGAIVWDIGFNTRNGKPSSKLPFFGIFPMLISAFLLACFLVAALVANLK